MVPSVPRWASSSHRVKSSTAFQRRVLKTSQSRVTSQRAPLRTSRGIPPFFFLCLSKHEEQEVRRSSCFGRVQFLAEGHKQRVKHCAFLEILAYFGESGTKTKDVKMMTVKTAKWGLKPSAVPCRVQRVGYTRRRNNSTSLPAVTQLPNL